MFLQVFPTASNQNQMFTYMNAMKSHVHLYECYEKPNITVAIFV